MLPTIAKGQTAPPTEEVLLVRDEVANMAWGVERVVALPTGASRMGNEVAAQTVSYLANLVAAGGVPPAPAMTDAVRYQVMNTVPENWSPFIPVHVPGSNREIQLQRAAMPRILPGSHRLLPPFRALTRLRSAENERERRPIVRPSSRPAATRSS